MTDKQSATAPPAGPRKSKFKSDDNWFDVSGFLDEAYGFVPVVAIITEPAVGYGLGGALLFVDKNKENPKPGFGRPNLTAVGGMGTENGTKGLFAFDSRYWLDDRVQTLTGFFDASINLDFHGIGNNPPLEENPVTYTIEPLGGVFLSKFRLGKSGFSAGVGYGRFSTKVSFEADAADPRLPEISRESNVGGALLSATYDVRDNLFTPTRGFYADLSGGVFTPGLGSDDDFQRTDLTVINYIKLNHVLTLGINGGAAFSFNDIPFYMKPFIVLRGVPLMRYQGDQAAQVEAEVRWQLWKRFSLVFFAGTGAAWNDFDRLENKTTTVAGGTGFRYEIAKKYGLHMGLDVARGEEETAIYIQFGSAWMRP